MSQPDINDVLALIEADHAAEVSRLRRNWAVAQARIATLEKQIERSPDEGEQG